MEHIGIDLGSRQSQVCVRSQTGELLEERRVSTVHLDRYLQGRSAARVVVETGSESFCVADMALSHGHQVRVVPASLVRSLGVGQRGIKNDVRDARVLSEVSTRIDLPSVHIPSEHSRELKALNTSREALVGCRTKLINRTRSYLRTHIGSVKCAPKTLPKRARERLLQRPEGLPAHIEAVLLSIEALSSQIHALDEQLLDIAKHDERTRRLMSVPGVGPVTATRFVAAVDSLERFEDGAHLGSYIGLTPGENTTGFVVRRTRLTKAGQPALRHALVQAAWGLWRLRPNDPLVLCAKQIAERRGKQIAIVALARKLALVLFAIWRDQSAYDPTHLKG